MTRLGISDVTEAKRRIDPHISRTPVKMQKIWSSDCLARVPSLEMRK